MTIQEDFTRVLRETGAGRASEITKEIDGERYVRRFIPEDRLIILGAGHIALPLCRMSAMLDFAVTVVDDRPSFANRGRFPDAAQVVCDSFAKAIGDLKIRPTDYICVITRGHRWDGECLRQILRGEYPSYLGMIGSRRRVTGLLGLLREEGYDSEKLEIAVSICAELVQHRRSHPAEEDEAVLERTDTNFELLRFLAGGQGPAALMTVISTRGSTPVESGAIMVMDSLGKTIGTIGGGCGEAEVMTAARRLIGTGQAKTVEVDMTNDIAEEEGMVCGGKMRVLVEDIGS